MNSVARPTWWRRGCLAVGRVFFRLAGEKPVTVVNIHLQPGLRVKTTKQLDAGRQRLSLDVVIDLVNEAQALRLAHGDSRSAQAMSRRYGLKPGELHMRMDADASALGDQLTTTAAELKALRVSGREPQR